MADEQSVAEKHDEAHKQDEAAKEDRRIALYGFLIVAAVAGTIFGLLLTGVDAGQGLAFAGPLLTGAVSFVGVVLKRNSDRQIAAEDRRANERSAAEDRRERERLAAEDKREKDRLEVEAATNAANLLSTPDGEAADQATTAGALLSLVRLDQVNLASSMLRFLWEQNRISDADGVFIVNEALDSKDPQAQQAQRDASNVLLLKTPQLTMVEGKDDWYYWPFVVDHRWKPTLPIEVRYTLLRAWVYLWTASESASLPYRLRQLVAGLVACLQEEPDPTIKGSVARMLSWIFDVRGKDVQGATEMVKAERVTFTAEYMAAELENVAVDASTEVPDDLLRLQEVLKAWLDNPDQNRTKDFLLPGERRSRRRRSATTRSPSSNRAKRRSRPRARSR